VGVTDASLSKDIMTVFFNQQLNKMKETLENNNIIMLQKVQGNGTN
jgi:hypothetical protein